jgi:hypothetical protein
MLLLPSRNSVAIDACNNVAMITIRAAGQIAELNHSAPINIRTKEFKKNAVTCTNKKIVTFTPIVAPKV